LVYRLGSINANLVGDELQFDEGCLPKGINSSYRIEDNKVWLVSYLAGDGTKSPLPFHSTSDAFKIGKVMGEYEYDWQDLEKENLEMEL